ncbi:hypothetical protein DOY81_010814, partial [Sarcophaga bullata]
RKLQKRLNTLINQLLPFLQADHQHRYFQGVNGAKQVTNADLNLIIGIIKFIFLLRDLDLRVNFPQMFEFPNC